MAHPQINNSTPMVICPLFVSDEFGAPILVPLVRGTFRILPEEERLEVNDQQLESVAAGEFTDGLPGASYKYEPETAFIKVATDIVLVGHAQSPTPVQTLDVGLKLGNVQKTARVTGDRFWVKHGGQILASRPAPFTRMPLTWERAFGGWDRADKDEENWKCDSRNPVGVGFGDPLRFVQEGKVPLPNVEDPAHLIRQYGDRPPPAGFGFVSPSWESRARYAGTYDEEWDKSRKPFLPKDFDRRFLSAAPEGLVASGFLSGDEAVFVVNASPRPRLRFKLPGIPSPLCIVTMRGGRQEAVQTNLDTVIINTDEMLVILLWRNYVQLVNGPHDVVAIDVATRPDGRVAV